MGQKQTKTPKRLGIEETALRLIRTSKKVCGGLSDLHRFVYLNAWFLLWEGLGGVKLFEEVCHFGNLKVHSRPSLSLYTSILGMRCQLSALLQCHACLSAALLPAMIFYGLTL